VIPFVHKAEGGRRNFPRYIALSLLLLAAGSAAALLAGEFLLRVIRPSVRQPFLVGEYVESERGKFCVYDPMLGWAGKPGVNTDFSYVDCRHHVRQNAYGFRGAEHGFARTAKRRIAVLGDSVVWGFGVEDGEIFTAVLEREMVPPAEVINLGVSGYGTDQEYLLWRSFGSRFRPDEVILTITFENDLWNNVVPSSYRYPKPVFSFAEKGGYRVLNQPVPRSSSDMWDPASSRLRPAGAADRRHMLGRAAARSALAASMITALARHDGLRLRMERRGMIPSRDNSVPEEAIVHMEPPPAMAGRAWDSLFRLIGLLNEDVRRNGAALRVLIVPAPRQVYPDLWARFAAKVRLPSGVRLDPDGPNRRITGYCLEKGIAVTDPLPDFRAAARGDLFLFFPWNGHWTAAGHRIAADSLLRDMASPAVRH